MWRVEGSQILSLMVEENRKVGKVTWFELKVRKHDCMSKEQWRDFQKCVKGCLSVKGINKCIFDANQGSSGFLRYRPQPVQKVWMSFIHDQERFCFTSMASGKRFIKYTHRWLPNCHRCIFLVFARLSPVQGSLSVYSRTPLWNDK